MPKGLLVENKTVCLGALANKEAESREVKQET